jgi:hypothetical protein
LLFRNCQISTIKTYEETFIFSNSGNNNSFANTMLNTYTAVSSSIDDIVTRIQLHPGEKGFMPFKRARLSDSTINVFKQWKADGLLEK